MKAAASDLGKGMRLFLNFTLKDSGMEESQREPGRDIM